LLYYAVETCVTERITDGIAGLVGLVPADAAWICAVVSAEDQYNS
jgi:hypothetical protein